MYNLLASASLVCAFLRVVGVPLPPYLIVLLVGLALGTGLRKWWGLVIALCAVEIACLLHFHGTFQ